ncbi:hypothetical protein [Acinetobacter baumannii]|uniref:hypothetical protein n=1 Tax=Acinetobacter baumannii TaxID=470 RepID=UPI0038CD3F7A
MMILRGFTDDTGAVQRQPREAAGAERGENTADPALAAGRAVFHGGAGCATAGDCGGTAGLPLPGQSGGERAAGPGEIPG